MTVNLHSVAGPDAPALAPEDRRLVERVARAVDDVAPITDHGPNEPAYIVSRGTSDVTGDGNDDRVQATVANIDGTAVAAGDIQVTFYILAR